jgi:hypothetical protein
VRSRIKAAVRVLRGAAKDPRIPRPVRWLLVAGLLPVPGPFDEAVLLLALVIIAVFFRPVLRDLLRRSAEGDERQRAGTKSPPYVGRNQSR